MLSVLQLYTLILFLRQKILAYLRYNNYCNFSVSLTNDIVSFEQLGLSSNMGNASKYFLSYCWQQ